MKDELGGKLMTEFTALGPKTYSYLSNENDENMYLLKKPTRLLWVLTMIKKNSINWFSGNICIWNEQRSGM